MFPSLGGVPFAGRFGSLRWPDLSRQVGWPSAGFASRLADFSHLVNGTYQFVVSREIPADSAQDNRFAVREK